MAPIFCRWVEDEDGLWQTDCGHEFQFIDAGPRENKMRFCCYCGLALTPKPVKVGA